jgi:hypothetical protein
MSEIGISVDQFNQTMKKIGQGFEFLAFGPPPSYSSTYSSAVKPAEILEDINAMLVEYLQFIRSDTEKCIMIVGLLMAADQDAATGMTDTN